MANFFRALGAATPALNMTARTLMEYGQQMREAPLREAQTALTQQRVEEMKFEREQKKKEAAELDAPIEGSILFDQFTQGFTEEQKKQGKEMLVKHGVLTPDGLTSKRKMADAQKMILMSKQASEWVQTAKRDASLRQGQDIMAKLQKSKESQDQGKIDEYTKAYDDWSKGHNSMLGNFEQMEDMRTGMELYKQVKESGIEIPPEAMAVIATAANTGNGVKDAVAILKELATKGKAQGTTGRPFSVSGGVYDPETKEFKQPPWAGEGGTGKPEKPSYDVIWNMDTGEEKYITKGSPIPKGWTTSTRPAGAKATGITGTTQKAGGKEPASITAASINLAGGKAVIDTIREEWNKLPHVSGIAGKLHGYTAKGVAAIGEFPEAKAYDDYVKGTAAPLLRAIGEKGTQSDRDIERALNLIPRYPDTKKEAEEKLRLIGKFIEKTEANIEEIRRKSMGGKETTQQEKANIMSEADARKALTTKGITGKAQDGWIDTYKKQGVVK